MHSPFGPLGRPAQLSTAQLSTAYSTAQLRASLTQTLRGAVDPGAVRPVDGRDGVHVGVRVQRVARVVARHGGRRALHRRVPHGGHHGLAHIALGVDQDYVQLRRERPESAIIPGKIGKIPGISQDFPVFQRVDSRLTNPRTMPHC